jgi:hypothetical protein
MTELGVSGAEAMDKLIADMTEKSRELREELYFSDDDREQANFNRKIDAQRRLLDEQIVVWRQSIANDAFYRAKVEAAEEAFTEWVRLETERRGRERIEADKKAIQDRLAVLVEGEVAAYTAMGAAAFGAEPDKDRMEAELRGLSRVAAELRALGATEKTLAPLYRAISTLNREIADLGGEGAEKRRERPRYRSGCRGGPQPRDLRLRGAQTATLSCRPPSTPSTKSRSASSKRCRPSWAPPRPSSTPKPHC